MKAPAKAPAKKSAKAAPKTVSKARKPAAPKAPPASAAKTSRGTRATPAREPARAADLNRVLVVEPSTVTESTGGEVAIDAPEREFSARVSPPLAERARPQRRRAIFIDVENTSRASQIQEALDALAIDHSDAFTDLVASGNWRVIGNETARILARKGAQLIHSAPATGVRDWSDLRIAVAAGVWLASARPGDTLQIISDDRAFDAVGDVAATLGVEFTRLSYRNGRRGQTSVAGPPERREARREPRREPAAGGRSESVSRAQTLEEGQAESRRPRRRRGGRSRSEVAPVETSESVSTPASAPEAPASRPERSRRPPATKAPERETSHGSAGTAPTEDLLSIVSELLASSPAGVPLDALARRLKELGFSRPPGSPRLVTRVRAIRELSVAPNGVIRLTSSGASDAAPSVVEEPEAAPAARAPAASRPAPNRPQGNRAPASRPPSAQAHMDFAPSAPPDFGPAGEKEPTGEEPAEEVPVEGGEASKGPRRPRRRGGRGRRKPDEA